ncbi:unnamed protein product [Rotaria socialis]|uniref:RecA family profile 1 domain-containing protein n=1 Tax=Rotaria socialis TaxID=392032 RepID=A0A818V029_9BILA|nr:unnamed protein product [Rotaria socialis]CAF4464798.1 unnamed protein product [Rotaria socialis]
MSLTLNDIDLPLVVEEKLRRVYGAKYSLKNVLELDPDELIRTTRLKNQDIDLTLQCISNTFYPFTRRQMSVWQMTEKERDLITTFSTGCPIIDDTLGGGIRLGQITELYGESGCGKTQLCIQMSLEVQRTFRARGQEAKVVYINTESHIEKIDKRLKHISYYRAKADKPFNIADARCLQQHFFDNIYIDIIRHYRHLEMTLVERLPLLLNREPSIRLIIIDSLAALFRSEDILFEHHTKANTLQYLGFAMHTLCHRYNLAIVCVNQVQTQFSQIYDGSLVSQSMTLAPALGLTWAFIVHCRIKLSKTENIEEHHPDSQQSQIVFDEHKATTRIKTNLVHLRSLSVDYCYHIPKLNRCNYFIVDKGVFGSRN